MTRSIDIDAFGPTIEEKVLRFGKRACAGFAIAAITISALDLMNVGAVHTASRLFHDSRAHYAELPAAILAGIRGISVMPNDNSVTVAVPRDPVIKAPVVAALAKPPVTTAPAARIAAAPPPPVSVSGASNSPLVAELSDVRHADAVEFAMASPAALERAQPAMLTFATSARALPVVAQPEQVRPSPAVAMGAASADSIKLASLDAGAVPSQAAMPAATAVALTMAAPIPLNMVPLPVPAPGVPPPSPAQRLHLEGKDYDKAARCLANAIYWEARSEPVKGQEAVAQVVMNRVFSGFYPGDVCSVVYQNASRHLSCQFTFACDGKRKVITERGHWARATRIAKQTLDGQIYVPEVAKSTHYHATYVHPNWVREMRKMVRFGVHNFYRPYAWGNGADQPAWGRKVMASNTSKKK